MSTGNGCEANTGLLESPIPFPISFPSNVYAATAKTYFSPGVKLDTLNSQLNDGTCQNDAWLFQVKTHSKSITNLYLNETPQQRVKSNRMRMTVLDFKKG